MTQENDRGRIDRLEGALATLEQAVARVAGGERTRADLADSLAAMEDDRQRLAADLDGALARARSLERASETVERRLQALADRLVADQVPAGDHAFAVDQVVTMDEP